MRERPHVFTDLLGLGSCHGNDAADPLSDGLLGDDDERPHVSRVLQMSAGKHGKQLTEVQPGTQPEAKQENQPDVSKTAISVLLWSPV